MYGGRARGVFVVRGNLHKAPGLRDVLGLACIRGWFRLAALLTTFLARYQAGA